MATPAVSVVIPLYNHAGYIEVAIRSALEQTLAPGEVIVVDDGSRDKGPAIVRDLARDEPRIVLWSQPNQDAYFALNAGIHRATGEVVAILNSDDAFEATRLERCVSALSSDSHVAAVATGIRFMDDYGKPIRLEWYDEALAFYRAIGDLALALVNGNFLMTTSNLVVRRSVFKQIGGFARLRYAHDLDFMLRVLSSGQQLIVIEDPLLRYRVHESNTIKEEHRKVRIEWAAAAAAFAHRALTRRENPCGWDFVSRLTKILDRHALAKNFLFFLMHFARSDEKPARADSYLDDPSFRDFLTAHAK